MARKEKGGENMTIEERLENMEREVGRQKRRNRWLLGAILLLAGGLIVPTAFRTRAQGAGTAKEVRAEAFIVEDENGKDRAVLSVTKDGPYLALYDKNGKSRAWLAVDKDIPGLTLYDKNGKSRAELDVLKNGPRLSLFDENGKSCIGLAVIEEGPLLLLDDKNGKSRAWLAVEKNGPSLSLLDEKGKIRFVAGKTATETPNGKITEYPESSLILFGPDGKVIWRAIK